MSEMKQFLQFLKKMDDKIDHDPEFRKSILSELDDRMNEAKNVQGGKNESKKI